MIVFPRGEVKTWSDLTPGALFGVSIGGDTHLAVKIQGSGGFYCCLDGNAAALRARKRQKSLLYFFPVKLSQPPAPERQCMTSFPL